MDNKIETSTESRNEIMTSREALDLAIASLVYRRAIYRADMQTKRIRLDVKLRIQKEVARYDEAIRQVTAIRDLGVADEIETGTVTVRTLPAARPTVAGHTKSTALGAVTVPHDPAGCSQCSEDEYR